MAFDNGWGLLVLRFHQFVLEYSDAGNSFILECLKTRIKCFLKRFNPEKKTLNIYYQLKSLTKKKNIC